VFKILKISAVFTDATSTTISYASATYVLKDMRFICIVEVGVALISLEPYGLDGAIWL